MKPNIPFLTVAIAALGSLHLSPAIACECRAIDVKEEFASSKAVFSGKVALVDEEHNYAIFEVMQSWKGAKTKTIKIQLSEKGRLDGCGLYAKQKEEYLVFAYGDSVLTTGMCSSRPLADSEQAVQELNEHVAVTANTEK